MTHPCLRYLAFLSMAPAFTMAATPTLSGITGTVAQGQTITINGTSMIQENKTNWDPMFVNKPTASSFEGTNLVADGYTTSGCPQYTTAVKLMGSKSLNMHDSGQHIRLSDGSGLGSCNWQWVIQASKPGSNWSDVYLRTYSRWNNTSWATIDTKYWWIANGANYAFFNLIANADGSPPTQFGVYTSGLGNWIQGTIPGGAIQNNKWYLFEAHFRMAGTNNYIIELWVDNQRILSRSVPDGPSPNPGGWGYESNTNYFNTPAGWVSDQWQDGFVVSRTRVGPASLIEVGNCSVYTSGTKVYQEPVFLSETSSQIKLNLSGLGTGPYYLWVTNNSGERSAPLNIGGSGSGCGVTGIAAPTNLRVQ